MAVELQPMGTAIEKVEMLPIILEENEIFLACCIRGTLRHEPDSAGPNYPSRQFFQRNPSDSRQIAQNRTIRGWLTFIFSASSLKHIPFLTQRYKQALPQLCIK
jgi:hypothetical protein